MPSASCPASSFSRFPRSSNQRPKVSGARLMLIDGLLGRAVNCVHASHREARDRSCSRCSACTWTSCFKRQRAAALLFPFTPIARKENRRDRWPVANAARGFTEANDLEDGGRSPGGFLFLAAARHSRYPAHGGGVRGGPDVTRTCTQRFRLFSNEKGHVPRSRRTPTERARGDAPTQRRSANVTSSRTRTVPIR